MKKIHYIALVMIAAAIVIFTTASNDMTTFSTFEEASVTGNKVKIAGNLAKTREMVYDPAINPNKFTFYLIDSEGVEKKIILSQPKPQDFELAEQIVVTGKMKDDTFIASEVLTKCPSKYKDEEIYLKDA